MGLVVVLVVAGVVLPAGALVGAGLRSARPSLRAGLIALGALWAAAGVGAVVALLLSAG